MIKIKRKPPIPRTLSSQKVINALDRIKEKLQNGESISSEDFPPYWRADDVRLTLWKHQHRKCCYCERLRDAKREPDIEHFRPKAEIKEVRKPGYWSLAYDWANLLFSCKYCNQTKSSYFPMNSGTHALMPDDVMHEDPVLPQPELEDPEDFIDYRFEFNSKNGIDLACPVGKDEAGRGDKIIKLLKLNRPELSEDRGRLLLHLNAIAAKMHVAQYLPNSDRLFEKAKKEISKMTKSTNEFAGFRRAFFKAHGLGDFVSSK